MKKLLLALTLSMSIPFNLYAKDDQFDKGIDLLGTSLEFIQTVEPGEKGKLADGPLFDAYLCVYTNAFTNVVLNNLNGMMKNILKNVKNSSSIAKFVFDLMEEEDPKFFDRLLSDDTSDESPIKKCNTKIRLAKEQKYVSELIIKKTLSLAMLTGLNIGEGLYSDDE